MGALTKSAEAMWQLVSPTADGADINALLIEHMDTVRLADRVIDVCVDEFGEEAVLSARLAAL